MLAGNFALIEEAWTNRIKHIYSLDIYQCAEYLTGSILSTIYMSSHPRKSPFNLYAYNSFNSIIILKLVVYLCVIIISIYKKAGKHTWLLRLYLTYTFRNYGVLEV